MTWERAFGAKQSIDEEEQTFYSGTRKEFQMETNHYAIYLSIQYRDNSRARLITRRITTAFKAQKIFSFL